MSWKKMTVGKRIMIGFGVVVLLLIALGILSYTGVGSIVNNAKEVIDGNMLDATLAQKEVDHLNWANKVNALLTDDNVTEINVQLDHKQCECGKWLYGEGRKEAEALVPSLAPYLKELEEPHKHLHDSAREVIERFHQADLELGNFLREKKTDHLKWANRVKDVFVDQSLKKIDVEMDPKKCSLGVWMFSPEVAELKQKDPKFASLIQELEEPHKKYHESAKVIQKLLDEGKRDEARTYYMQNTEPLAKETLGKIDKILEWQDKRVEGMKAASAIYAKKTIPSLHEVQRLLNEVRAEAKNNLMTDKIMLDAAQSTKRNVSIVGLVAIAVAVVLAFIIASGIVRVLKSVSTQMLEGAGQVASASGQVSAASQSLAEGASEQAASIEETSSSMEEMASMTKQNANHAQNARSMMDESSRIIEKVNDHMEEMAKAVAEITSSSEETGKIIKTIDEIAFQTNLLALNAAVEAARAGEAGAGFAVVADEVRSLAMRAAEAAKSTSELIENTIGAVKKGSELTSLTKQAFKENVDIASKISNLIQEISAASQEQAEGIDQVNLAITQMDKVTQQNAANAEESASASEEMNAQAEQMKESAVELMELVGGANGNIAKKNHRGSAMTNPKKINKKSFLPKSAPKKGNSGTFSVAPQEVFPLDDEEEKGFKDF